MHKKILIILIFLSLALSTYSIGEEDIYPAGYANSSEGEDAVYLTLEEVSQLSLNNNFDIQLAKFDAQLKETDLDSARSIYDTIIEAEAQFKDDRKKTASSLAGTSQETHNYNFGISQKLPTGTTLGLDFDNQRYWTDSSFVEVNPAHDSSAKLTLKQELGRNFFGIRDRSNIKITKIDIQNAQYTSLDKIEQTLSVVQETYWRVAQCLSLLTIRQDMLLKAKELFRINQEKFQRGIIEKPQLIASEANLRQREIDLLLAQNELEFYINEFKLLLNLDNLDKTILPKETLDLVSEAIELSQALKAAFQHRRDYSLAKNEVESKKIKLVMDKNNLWPEINLEASVRRNGLNNHFSQAFKNISSEDNPEYFLGLKVTLPLQNSQARSEFNKAKIQKAMALINLKKTECKILVDIKDSVRNCDILEQRARKQKNVVNLQEEKLEAELKAYQYGRSDTDTIIRYQDDLLLSELLYTQALMDYKQALIELSLKENTLLDQYFKDAI